ncbi:hypothetical protein [Cochlodiniinecator piscidefendens]|uniref:hypothetical protein n=1 Tax=Cochlodiniinecator piscidefendens TaxID=2715756 RepID=UPI0014085099|nr:hypothetical protein [Cochlodiniinecator piscidefendens]
METSFTTTTTAQSWQFVPANAFVGVILTVLFIYLFFRHLMVVFVVWDLIIGWLRKFRWFPKEGQRLKALMHWVIAIVLVVGFLIISNSMGWITVVPTP